MKINKKEMLRIAIENGFDTSEVIASFNDSGWHIMQDVCKKKMIGFLLFYPILFEGDTVEIYYVNVAKEYQSRGLGIKMIRNFIKRAKEELRASSILVTNCKDELRKFYSKFGKLLITREENNMWDGFISI